MSLLDRLEYAVISGLFGCALGVLCWFLHGHHAVNHSGAGIDAALRHWVTSMGGAFAVLGAVLGAKAADVVGDVLNALFRFKFNDSPGKMTLTVAAFAIMCLLIVVIGVTAPR
jgi:hypothetical protein